MKRIPVTGLFLLAVVVSGCHGQGSCARGDWCDCSGGSECYQGCAGDGNACRMFCHNMDRCGATCGETCNFECYSYTGDCSADCGDQCHISCNDGVSCGASCGANCNYTCWDMKSCGVTAGPGSLLSCNNVDTCVVECLGDCSVYCSEQVGNCKVTCPNGASPVSCPDGKLACGSC
ncbi:MAG: hypothetical protein ABSB49_00790 [Polyangia bacterium]|jgi:hypothetical protein